MSKALAGLKGEMAGKYYPLNRMTQQEQEQLINASQVERAEDLLSFTIILTVSSSCVGSLSV